jgi:THO complex subunit 1
LSDLAFQRHILVQALILLDFLLSLTDKAKKRLAHLPTQKTLKINHYTLSEQNACIDLQSIVHKTNYFKAEWAEKTKKGISRYVLEGPDGKFYHRMVDTVLSRDKNWVRWKLENCPLITRVPLASEEFGQGKSGAKSSGASRRTRNQGALDLRFLSDAENVDGLQRLGESAR